MTTRQKVEAFLGAASGRRGMGTWREWLRGVLFTIEDTGQHINGMTLDGCEGWASTLELALKAHGVRFCDVLDYLFNRAPDEERLVDALAKCRQHADRMLTDIDETLSK